MPSCARRQRPICYRSLSRRATRQAAVPRGVMYSPSLPLSSKDDHDEMCAGIFVYP